MHKKKKITQNNIYVVWQFVYVYGVAMILLFTRKNIRGGNTVFLSLNNMPKNTNLQITVFSILCMGFIIG